LSADKSATDRKRAGRYVTLDGLRGIAAMCVALFHFVGNYMPQGYLAVDFFFALSGFVLYRAYYQRWRKGLGTAAFMAQRVVRLYPLFALGVLLSAATMAVKVRANWDTDLSMHDIWVSLPLNMLMLPSPVDLPLFPLNVPAWSLFFELVANFAMIVVLFRLPRLGLIAVCLFSAWWITPIMMAHHSGNIGALWSEIGVGLARTAFSFTIGMLIASLPQPASRNASWLALLCLAAIVVAFALPFDWADTPQFDLVFILVLSPLLLLLGSRVEPPAFIVPAALFTGDVSYALYAVHWPFVDVFRYFQVRFDISPAGMTPFYFAAVIACAWLFARLYDAPLRKLMGRLIARPRALDAATSGA